MDGEVTTTPQILVTTDTPDVQTTETPGVLTTESPEVTTQPDEVTEAPTEAPTETPEVTTPEDVPEVETTETPDAETTEAPVVTTEEAPVVTTTEQPIVATTEEPVVETTEQVVVTTTEQPDVQPTEPVTTEQPDVQPTEPVTTDAPDEPVATTEDVVDETTQPPVVTTEAPDEPVVTTEEVVDETTEPPVVTTEPPEEPVVTTEEEVVEETTEAPVITTETPDEPIETTEAPVVTTEPVVDTTEPPVDPAVTTEEPEDPVVTTEGPVDPVVTTEAPAEETTTAPADESEDDEPEETTTASPVEPVVTTEPPTTALIYSDCTCTSTDKTDLTAEQCDQHGDCVACDASVCGTQADWTEWTDCSVTCGGGTRTREECFTWESGDNDGTEDCDEESEDCNEQDCPAWAAWKPWGSCSAQCKESGGADPTRSRYRCWDDGTGEECAGGQTTSGAGETCGRDASDVCYQLQEESCNEDIECTVECEWSEWGEWGDCTPACKDGLRIRRRTNNEDEGASCDGAGAASERCTNVETEECPECLNYYEKCHKIPTSFCSDIRYSAQLERLCNKHCGYCSKRRKRSIFDRFPRQSDFTVLEFLADTEHDL